MATIYGKIDCISSQSFSNNFDGNRLTQEIYVNFFKFMTYLQVQGVSELVTTYGGYEFWGATGSAAGPHAFSVWKMKANANRNWDWYLYIHGGYFNSGSFTSVGNAIPTRIMTKNSGGTPLLSTSEPTIAYYGIYVQAAFSISASSSVNPWNGTIDLTGNAQKNATVWSTGSSGYTVHVFPRINNLSGSANTEKDAASPICRYNSSSNINTETKFNYHFLSDGDGILFLNQAVVSGTKPAVFPNNYGFVSYLGPFTLLDGIVSNNSGSLLGGTGSKGFCMLSNNAYTAENATLATYTNIFSEYTDMGPASAGVGGLDGGAFAIKEYGVRTCALGADNSVNTTTFQPNAFAGNKIEGRQYHIFSTEIGYQGCLGVLDSSLFRVMGGSPTTHDITSDGNYAIFGASNTANKTRLIVPWSGSAPGTNITRDGILFTKTGFNF